ncbi:probable C-mannosyltransferase DPY19L1 isoform X2 [Sinocyclocheilus anshuiensis]|uniref:Probable C-mannosyltransferase DPY19L1 n=1 Tax=Sinocyclocheilus anshuiensis TaxID=1608454 RepID=A0A671M5L1_9TELE|nr:PREDICTED: probable C-mannosyltransferase DPY19L1 isoform X1 [Sinocyclocheilus anshuiensis]XP_016313877.1 PREDICTED: probable C-mannosyltransferase DPY19L1 isoform X2 [Sinocyclocheilus anshuiensis]
MVVKTRKSNAKDQSGEKDRSQSALGKSKRAKDGKGSASQSKNGYFAGFIRSKLGLSPSAFARGISVLVLALIVGFLHWYHLSHLFENDRHFSHMSSLEKEMAFRTEMGLYYSYFKTIIKAPSFMDGLYMIMNDRLTEYPLVINTLKRFNLYPEVVLASWYRAYASTMDFLGIPTKMCWTINRGEGLDPVESCEGLGDPAYFYVTFVFLLNGAMMSLFFIYGTYLSGSRLGGTVTVLCFFFNHGESTRVMWTPPLRESFSYPFLVLQMLLLTYILRTRNPSKNTMMALGISNIFFMLPWQFAQFVLLTQVASLFASYILGYLSPAKMQSVLVTHMISLAVCFLLMFGNSMLLTSFYASSLVSIWGIIALRDWLVGIFKPGLFTWVMQCLAWVVSTVILKFMLSVIFGASDDAHISSLIKSKFSSYKDFDTMMYTCAAEFDFIETETLIRYIKTMLLPINVLIVGFIAGRTIQDIIVFLRNKTTEKSEDDEMEQSQMLAKGVLVYHSLQLVAFAVLAVLIMRLKLFLTPHMCIMSCLICSRQLFGWVGEKFKLQLTAVGILSIMAVQGVTNLQSQWDIIGEFSNFPQEELLEWIKDNTSPNAVFAGAMPTMASVKLSTGRAIVNHPHYEDAGLRERTKMVYAMYSRKPAEVVKRNLIKLQVDYFILEDSWCTRRSKPGCSMPEIWDVEDAQNAGKVPLCTLMWRDSRPHFSTIFHNNIYKVLRVPKTVRDMR